MSEEHSTLFHVITLTLALDAASHLPSGLKEQCKIATARAGKKISPRNVGIHQLEHILSRLHTWNTGIAPKEMGSSKREEEAKTEGKSQTEKNNNHVTATEVIG